MDIFKVHEGIINDYRSYIESFVNIKKDFIKNKVEQEISSGKLWPQPLIQFNPSYKSGRSIDEMVGKGILHKDLNQIFKGYNLYEHQVEAITLGSNDRNFVVTSGTGSGKSLTYLGTIFNHLLNSKKAKGIKAIIIYPMNALINSQFEEITKYKDAFEKSGSDFPITYAQYTGQEDEDRRKVIREELPDIILTNYMMLELILTRLSEEGMRNSIYQSLKYVVFDELHTYRGRQGSDVGLLIRRLKAKCNNDKILCIGTSATMISGGTIDEQKLKVAEVASTFFGAKFHTDQVVIESLVPSLSKSEHIDLKSSVIETIERGIDKSAGYAKLINNALAKWLEKHIALLELNDSIVVRNKPMTVEQIIQQLKDFTDLSYEACYRALEDLLHWIAEVNVASENNKEKTILPFKLHQFISQTGSVYITLDEKDEDKMLTLQAGVYISKDGGDKKPIYPIVFSRESGHEFVCVTKNQETKKLDPREFTDWDVNEEDGESNLSGYLLYGEDIWDESDIFNLPDAWLNAKGDKVIKKYRNRIPKKIWFDKMGNFLEAMPLNPSDWQQGWFMPYKLLFDPTSGTFYDAKTNERTKLTKLGSEGRSTSTTILSFNILRKLAESGYDEEKQKLLSFTDNRQDAALQSGHFNDFVQTLHLRTGIKAAVHNSTLGFLEFAEIGDAIFNSLNLKQEDYAISTATFPGPRKENENALKDFLIYKVLYDLRRSWRVIMPNLEQCGLLKINYKYLNETIIDANFINQFDLLQRLEPDERLVFIYNTLDFFRKSYALRSPEFLDSGKIESKKRNIIQKLKEPWTLSDEEHIPEPNFMRYENVPRYFNKFTESIGYSSGYGRYFRHLSKEKTGISHSKETYLEDIKCLLELLDNAGWLYSEDVAGENSSTTTVYQLNIDLIQWVKSNEDSIQSDPIKTRSYKSNLKPANKFFKSIYSVDFNKIKKLEAADHTGQISDTAIRQLREQLFRDGKLSALYCSPTMELGIDISSLDIVHMRNVPPNPANYAQRSGRAGRSGQAALIFTYCSAYSPHDKNYFKQSIEMVSGNVAAPKLDLANEELLKTHLNALYLSEIGLSEINRSISDIVDEENPIELPIKDEVRIKIENTATTKLKEDVKSVFLVAIKDLRNKIENDKNNWFSDEWITRTISSFYNNLDSSLDRWRTLYKAARVQLEDATSIIKSGLYTVNSPEYKEAARNQQQATRQLSLLRNDNKRSLSEFYPFRYFASEGFLPGYNFTRLPIRTYLQAKEIGEFVSRPRFIALREFGPKNIIYHNGTKFSIDQLIMKEQLAPVKAKASLKSGYFLDGDDFNADTCPLTNTPVDNDNNRKNFINLVEMSETRGVQKDRISCDEEERASQGFEIDTYFSVPAGIHTITKAKASVDDQLLLYLQFIPSARLIQVNTKWRRNNEESFKVGVNSGFWRSNAYQPPEGGEEVKKIQLYTWDTADALYIQPVKSLGLTYEGVITLMYALKRAIEMEFQVEPREIGVSQMGDADNPNIFIYESAEGSLGILSQVVEDITIFNKLIKKAIEICRYNDDEYTAPASYDDLLSYFNQRHHLDIDRFLIKDKLEVLMNCNLEIESGSDQLDYDDHYKLLIRSLDKTSQTEIRFIDYLYKNNLRLPDSAQKKHGDIYVMPDFYYEKERTWIFCDGTPHDKPDVKERDKKQREAIINKGEFYWVYYYKNKLDEIVKERPDLFKKVR